LIQADLPMSQHNISQDPTIAPGSYYCHFMGKHPDDMSMPDTTSRFWPLWHRFSTDKNGIIDFGKRPSNCTLTKHIQTYSVNTPQNLWWLLSLF
jgi:hypothetical protein